jgi:hypothetical protein
MMDILKVDFQLRKVTKVTHTKNDHDQYMKKYEGKIRDFIDDMEDTMSLQEAFIVMQAIISPIHHRRVKNPLMLQIIEDYFGIN